MKRRVMARPSQRPRESRSRQLAAAGLVLVLVLAGLIAVSGILAGGPGATPTSSLRVAERPPTWSSSPAAAIESPDSTATARGTEPPSFGEPDPTAEPSAAPTNSPMPGSTAALANRAPTSPAEFDLEGQRISIDFPLRPDSRYQYRDNFLDVREGSPDDYNHARVNGDGTATRLHDGTDIYAAVGEPLIAPFSGSVVDPKSRWQPWEPTRYGNTVVIVSDEPTSAGYVALFVHLGEVWVDPGVHVTRGQVVGTVGRTGNAELQSVRAHLHFELRAPFLLDWSALGEDRAVDAFNPYPSLVAADPKRT